MRLIDILKQIPLRVLEFKKTTKGIRIRVAYRNSDGELRIYDWFFTKGFRSQLVERKKI